MVRNKERNADIADFKFVTTTAVAHHLLNLNVHDSVVSVYDKSLSTSFEDRDQQLATRTTANPDMRRLSRDLSCDRGRPRTGARPRINSFQ
ncbi:hypothetical protein A0H81_13982 [Grifola frondosa]|uniref:Uncharacterized protein n=1 Tax=Grifola frondosa TaxID=5627 RepID=A0A1C7LQ49_GRIFR|nr:hypothetical protein A0H81_13982 [Grifola frondosa]